MGVRTNLQLIKAARTRYPDAFIVYKPHPDVLSGNRAGVVGGDVSLFVDHIETTASVVSCIDACDVVVTMTSLSGFDALLRQKKVVVYGRPFYSGWGLTEDVLTIPRRSRKISLNEFVAISLLHYPIYWDPVLKGYTTCEAVLNRIIESLSLINENGHTTVKRSYFQQKKIWLKRKVRTFLWLAQERRIK